MTDTCGDSFTKYAKQQAAASAMLAALERLESIAAYVEKEADVGGMTGAIKEARAAIAAAKAAGIE